MTVTKKTRADGSTYFWIDFVYTRPDGQKVRVRQNSQHATATEAKAEEIDLMREARDRYLRGEAPGHEALTFADAVKRYGAPDSQQNNKPSWQKDKSATLRRVLLPRFGDMKLSDITNDVLVGFVTTEASRRTRRGKPPTPSTLNSYLRVMSRIMRLAHYAGKLPVMPRFPYVKEPPPQAIENSDFLSFDEADVFRAEAAKDSVIGPLVAIALDTGLRVGELRALKWANVDLPAGQLMVRLTVSEGADGPVETLPKGGMVRDVQLSSGAVSVLRAHRHLRGPYVFCEEDGARMSYDRLDTLLEAARLRSGLQKVAGFHIFRHTFASHLVMLGTPLSVVQKLLGHADLKTTQRYAHLSPDVKREAVERLVTRRNR